MDGPPPPASDAAPRAFGIAVAAASLPAGWVVAMPVGDRLLPVKEVLGLLCLALLGGGSLLLVGLAARVQGAVWGGAAAGSLLFLFARMAWPLLPVPMLMLASAAWWQSRQPRAPVPPSSWPPVQAAWPQVHAMPPAPSVAPPAPPRPVPRQRRA